MAKWTETLEPYVKVIESVKDAPMNIDAGGELIIGGVIRTNAGPLTPTLIQGRKSLLETFVVGEELTEDDDITLLNAYRLLGSNQMLLCRASGLNGCIYLRELKEADLQEYVYKQGQILKRVSSATFTISNASDWMIELNGIGTMGKTAKADLYVATLNALVEQFNETDKFHIPANSWTVSEDETTLTFTDIFVASDVVVSLSNMTTDLECSFELKNYIINSNATAGTLDVTITKRLSEDGLNRDVFQIDVINGVDEQTFMIGTDKEDGEISLKEFNELYGDVVQIVCPDGLEKMEFPTDSSMHIDLKIPATSNLLATSEKDYRKAWDLIVTDERYVVEGFCDLGECDTAHQNYIAASARALNAFYPISPCRATNYMTIANHFSKITGGANDMVLYKIAPWDEDDGTLGFKYDCSPGVMFWEAVSRNRANNNEFAAVLGEQRGVVYPVHLATEFNKKERQMLLTKNINTIFNDVALNSIYVNDCYTAQANKDIMQEEPNVRLKIRISRAMPILLSQFRGRQSNVKTWNDIKSVINYWMRSTIMPMTSTIADWTVICDSSINTPELQRQNKIAVRVLVKYYSVGKYIEVYHDCYSVGVEFVNE